MAREEGRRTPTARGGERREAREAPVLLVERASRGEAEHVERRFAHVGVRMHGALFGDGELALHGGDVDDLAAPLTCPN